MTGDSGRGQQSPQRALATSLEADRVEIIATFARELDASSSPIMHDPSLREQILENGNQILSDVVKSLRAGRVTIDESYKLLAREVGVTRAASAVPAQESLRAAVAFFEVMVAAVLRRLKGSERTLESLRIALLSLNRSINIRIREASTTYTGFLLTSIHEAHLNERRRIARELHDRVGSGLTIAHQQLELFDLNQSAGTAQASRIQRALRAVLESMDSLRAMTVDLRLKVPLQSLQRALEGYVDSMATDDDVSVHLRVNGDETWAPPTVRDEAFLIIREAIRNAVAHGNPSTVLVSVDIAPHELRARIEDDGHGFDRAESATGGGAGLSSMQERAALLGGDVTVETRPSEGTHVELVAPLPGRREADS